MIGIQLYSVRDDMKTDPSGTLKKLSAIGYKNRRTCELYKQENFMDTALQISKKFWTILI